MHLDVSFVTTHVIEVTALQCIYRPHVGDHAKLDVRPVLRPWRYYQYA